MPRRKSTAIQNAAQAGRADHWRAHWNIQDFINEQRLLKKTKAEIARSIGAGGQTMELWIQKGFSPFNGFKALMMLIPEHDRERWENSVVLEHSRIPSLFRYATGKMAYKYAVANLNRKFPIKGGGFHIIQEGAAPKRDGETTKPTTPEAAAAVATPPAPVEVTSLALADITPLAEEQEIVIPSPMGDIRVHIPARPKTTERGVHDVLIHISQRLLTERDQLERQLVGVRAQLATSEAGRSAAEQEAVRLRDEVKMYEELFAVSDATVKGVVLPPNVEKEAIQATRDILKKSGAPSLVHYLDQLPKHLAHS